MLNSKEILYKYWGYESFRHNQEEIIDSVLNGKDTIAILPTGGGKSLCFQIPSLMRDGICIVISPLISLMKDQLTSLKSKNIKSVALTHEMSQKDIEISLDNCIYGDYKFLYVSPERLNSNMVTNKISKMDVNLIAIDEAHCISSWGHDFRPSYRKISEIREIKPRCTLLALTATATADVISDIKSSLKMQDNKTIMSNMFRENISYNIVNDQRKEERIINILNRVKGSTIIYVKRRGDCDKITKLLIKNNISAGSYNAGMDHINKEKVQNDWQNDKIRVVVATNAFGMGINKSNVKLIIHPYIPSSIESYYQETGRAGRDEEKAYCIIIYDEKDLKYSKEEILSVSISIDKIKEIYNNICDHFQIALNEGEQNIYEFNIIEFIKKYRIKKSKLLKIINYLESEDYIKLEDSKRSSKVRVNLNPKDLSILKNYNEISSSLIITLLRNYNGITNNEVKINEEKLSLSNKISVKDLSNLLIKLQEHNILRYIPGSNNINIRFLTNRKETKHMYLCKKSIEEKQINEIKRKEEIKNYCLYNSKCRYSMMLEYFGYESVKKCYNCDICRKEIK